MHTLFLANTCAFRRAHAKRNCRRCPLESHYPITYLLLREYVGMSVYCCLLGWGCAQTLICIYICVCWRVCVRKQCKKVLNAKALFACQCKICKYVFLWVYVYSYIGSLNNAQSVFVVTTVAKFRCCIFTFTLAAVTGPAGVMLHYFRSEKRKYLLIPPSTYSYMHVYICNIYACVCRYSNAVVLADDNILMSYINETRVTFIL